MLHIVRARDPGPGPRFFPPGRLSVEFVNVGGWLIYGDLALDSCAQFLAVAEHMSILSRALSVCHQLRKAGHQSVWSPACQDQVAGCHAGVGVVSLAGASFLSPPFRHSAPRRLKTARAEEEVEHKTHGGQRALNTPPPGTRLAPLSEVAGPQGRPVALLSPGAGELSLASPALAGAAGEVVDSSALAILAAHAVQVREKEEAEELRQLDEVLATAEVRLVEALDPLRHDETWPRWSSLSPVEQAACHWFAAWLRREKRRRRTKTTRRTRFSTATVSSTSVCSVLASVSRRT